MIRLSKATVTTDISKIRAFMFGPSHMEDRFQINHRSITQGIPVQSFGHQYEDAVIEMNMPLLLSKPSYLSLAEYFIGMRPSWLCYRRHESVILKAYHPNRVARQFGFTQATPIYGLPQIPGVGNVNLLGTLPLQIRLEAASMSWAFMSRLGTGSRFYIPLQNINTGVSHLRLLWIRHTFSSFLEMGFRAYSQKIQKSGHIKRASASKRISEEESSHKRGRESSSVHKEHRHSMSPSREQKKTRSASPPGYGRTMRSEPLPQSEGLQIHQDIHDSLPFETDKVVNDRDNGVSSPIHQNTNQEESVQQGTSQGEPQLQSPEAEGNKTSEGSLAANKNEKENSTIPICQDANSNESLSLYENIQPILNVQGPGSDHLDKEAPGCELHAPALQRIEDDAGPLEGSNMIPLVCYLTESDTDKTPLGRDIAAANDTARSSFNQIESVGIMNEIPIIPVMEVEKQTSSHSESITGPQLIAGISGFTSQIHPKTARPSRGQFSKSLAGATMAIRELVMGIDVEALPELSDYSDDANILLNCAIMMGLDVQELQRWESVLRDIELAIFSIQVSQKEQAMEMVDDAEAAFKEISEKATFASKCLQEKLNIINERQEHILQANAEITSISARLERIEQERLYLEHRKGVISQNVVVMTEDHLQMKEQAAELEQMIIPLDQELQIACQRQEEIHEKYGQKAMQARAAVARIMEIQAENA